MYVYILWQGRKEVLTILEFAFVDNFYSKFQLVLTFSICSKILCWKLAILLWPELQMSNM